MSIDNLEKDLKSLENRLPFTYDVKRRNNIKNEMKTIVLKIKKLNEKTKPLEKLLIKVTTPIDKYERRHIASHKKEQREMKKK